MTVFLLALALAMDAFAVSITSGVTIKKMRLRHALRIAAFFGVFQAVMPILGWSLGKLWATQLAQVDHWIAFGLLLVIGVKMIYEAMQLEQIEKEKGDPLNFYILLSLAVATSIDAAAVGVSLSFLEVAIVGPSIVIGAITFVISLAGTYIGKRFGDMFGKKIEILGGIVLIGIGVKILVEHLTALG